MQIGYSFYGRSIYCLKLLMGRLFICISLEIVSREYYVTYIRFSLSRRINQTGSYTSE